MGLSDVERLMSRRQINRLIQSDSVEIVINRRAKVPTPSGGWRFQEPGVTLPPQTVTVVPFKRRMSEIMINTESGDVASADYVILGDADLDIQRHDTFSISGEQFKVEHVDLKTEVRKSALVEYYGGEHG